MLKIIVNISQYARSHDRSHDTLAIPKLKFKNKTFSMPKVYFLVKKPKLKLNFNTKTTLPFICVYVCICMSTCCVLGHSFLFHSSYSLTTFQAALQILLHKVPPKPDHSPRSPHAKVHNTLLPLHLPYTLLHYRVGVASNHIHVGQAIFLINIIQRLMNLTNTGGLAMITRVVLKIIKLVILIVKEDIMIIDKWNTVINNEITIIKEQVKERIKVCMNA